MKNYGITLMILSTLVLMSCSVTRDVTSTNGMAATSVSVAKNVETLPVFEAVPSEIFDNGRMWTFEYAPIEYFRETYDYAFDEAWFEHARLGSVRLPNCSGSFVSAIGLVMTNHHCAREQITQVGLSGEQLLDNGFYAQSLNDERKIEGYFVDQLVEIRDVTEFILNVVDNASPEDRSKVRQQAIEELEELIGNELDENHIVQVTSLYNGGRYSAYVFRRFNDVRLVMAPELQIGYYGGDADNFTYPRYNLDMTFFRVYENNEPLHTPYYFPFSRRGVEEGDAVFLIGNPGSTTRLQTVSQLTYRGQYGDRYYHSLIARTIQGLEMYYDIDPDGAESLDLRNFIFALKNAEKFFGGQVKALQDPALMGRRVDNELRFISMISSNEDLKNLYLPLIDEIHSIQLQKIRYSSLYHASLGISPNSRLSPAVLQRALLTYLYFSYRASGTPESQLEPLRNQIIAIQNKPNELEKSLLMARIGLFTDVLGADDPLVSVMLKGQNPESIATNIVNNSNFISAEETESILKTGRKPEDDPAMVFVSAFASDLFLSQESYLSLSEKQNELLSELGRAWFAIYGTTIPPDATFSPRISDGIVASYEYNGTLAPVYTTFYGLYDRASSHSDPQWDLPPRWEKPAMTLDLSTPVNFISTNDIIGGNSGSPVINTSLEIVGLAFDSNIEGMGSNDFILDASKARAVNVDVRGMIESLRHVYRADRLVNELMNPAITSP